MHKFFSWNCFARDQRGAVLPIIAFAFMTLMGSLGASVDLGRAQLVQSKLSSSLDAAGLAAGATISTADVETEVNKYLDANFNGYMGSTLTEVTVTVDSSNTVFSLSATAELPTILMHLFGRDTVEVHADAEVTRSVTGLELALVLDNTGSMAGTRLDALKAAAHELVDILYGGREEVEDLWIGLVPFAQAVNIGTDRTDWLDATTFTWGPTTWYGCVDARLNGYDVTDDPASVRAFTQYYRPDDSSNDWIRTDGTYRTPLTLSRGPNAACSQPVTPLTASRSVVETGIDAMQARGNTHVNLGAVWGWRMLSPRWRGEWGGEMDTNDLPLDYNAPRMNKAAVIMTDGENTMSSSVRTAHGYLSQGRLGTTSSSAAVTQLNTRLSQVCTSMKNNNIIVYTIAFGSPGTTIQNLLRNCATQPDFYFDSPSDEELSEAFRAIGDSLSNLRISQ